MKPKNELRIDGGTQPREAINYKIVEEYAEDMQSGAKFPPVTVYHDGVDYWLADGFHRGAAARRAGHDSIEANVLQGTQRDAILHSVGANAAHGFRRTNTDKRRGVTALLMDPEWSGWSDREIARRCAVSDYLVRDIRKVITACSRSDKPTERTYTTNIGVRPEPQPDHAPDYRSGVGAGKIAVDQKPETAREGKQTRCQ